MSTSRRFFLKQTGTAAAFALCPALAREAHAEQSSSLTLVRRGRSSYAIVILPGAPVAAQHGAEELQTYLFAMSGARLPIVAHADVVSHRLPRGVEPGHLITLGAASADAPLANDAFRLRTAGTRLEIEGGGLRGTLYGCYALLDDILGVRWWTPQVTTIPKRSTVTVDALDHYETPAMEYRFPYWAETTTNRDWSVRNRVNSELKAKVLDASVGSGLRYGNGFWAHTFSTLVPAAEYPQFWTKGQLCLSDPAAASVAATRLANAIRAEPEALIWSVSQDDNTSAACSCDRCNAVLAEEGAASGGLVRFVNAVATIIQPEFPNVLIDTLAYVWTETPPKLARPRANVRIRFAPLMACVAHPIGTCEKNRQAYANLMGWSKLTNQLYFWHYSTNFSHYFQPLPDITAMCADIATFQRLGGVGLFSEGSFQDGGGSFGELKSYVQAKLMWNPNRDGRAIVKAFVTGVYGSGASFVQQWIDAIEAEVVPGNGHDARHAGIYDAPSAPYLPDSLIARGVTLLTAAEQAAAREPVALEQLRKVRLGLDYVQWQRSPEGSADRARYQERVEATMRHFGYQHTAES